MSSWPITVLPLIDHDLDRQYDLAAVFGNQHPIEIELGIGKGRFLIRQAQERPEVNFIGVEWANRYYKLCVDRAGKRGLANIRMLRDDSAHFVGKTLPPGTIAALHIYFPDPWPKKRHHKRRLVQAGFVADAARILKTGAEVRLATDFEAYASQILEVFDASPEFEPIPGAEPAGSPEGATNWEVRFLAEGRKIFRIDYRRR